MCDFSIKSVGVLSEESERDAFRLENIPAGRRRLSKFAQSIGLALATPAVDIASDQTAVALAELKTRSV